MPSSREYQRAFKRAQRINNPEAVRARERAWKQKNAEKVKALRRANYLKNGHKYVGTMRKRRQANLEHYRASKQAARANARGDGQDTAARGEHLYILRRSDMPDLYKIGRSYNPRARAIALSNGQCFKVEVVATYDGNGQSELPVQYGLDRYRVQGGSSREWFRAPLDVIYSVVGLVLNSNSASAASTPGSSSSAPPPPVVEH